MVSRIQDKADKISINKENVRRAVEEYKKTKDGNLDVI
jgi:predicted aconitase